MCSILLITRKIQIKTIIRYHYTPTRKTKIKMADNTKYWQRWKDTVFEEMHVKER